MNIYVPTLFYKIQIFILLMSFSIVYLFCFRYGIELIFNTYYLVQSVWSFDYVEWGGSVVRYLNIYKKNVTV